MNWSAVTTGFVLSVTLIVAIGAQNAFVLRQGLRREHVSAVVAFCVCADLALVAAGVFGLAHVLRDAEVLSALLAIGGAVFLLAYGLLALKRALQPQALHAARDTEPKSLRTVMVQIAGFTLLNPHVYLDTILLLGSIGARQPAGMRFWFVGGSALASITWFSALGFGSRLLAPAFARPNAWRILDVIIGLTMLVLATQLFVQSVGPLL